MDHILKSIKASPVWDLDPDLGWIMDDYPGEQGSLDLFEGFFINNYLEELDY
jgi:hypothetical protein